MLKKMLAAAAVAGLSMGASAANGSASGNLLTDGDFESTGATLAGGPSDSYCYLNFAADECGHIAGWGGTNPAILTADSGPWGTPSAIAGASNLGGFVAGLQSTNVLSQDVALASGGHYTLTWSDANRTNYGGNQRYDISFGGQLLGTESTTAGAGWATHTIDFVANGSGTLSFAGLATNDSTTFIDNVRLTSAVPEPASVLLMLAGLLPLMAWRRRGSI